MTSYPSDIYEPREKENKYGQVYDPLKKTITYVEDVTKLDDEVVAIENELGKEPKGTSASVKERIASFKSLAGATVDLIVAKLGCIGIGTANPTSLLHLAGGTTTKAPLKLTEGDLLTTPEKGAIEFSNGRICITNKADCKAIDRTSDVALETVTVENTTDETLVWTGSMPANSLEAGNVFKLHADGIVSSDSASDLITIRIKVGGVTKATLVSAAKKLDEDHWHLEANATQRTIGATGSRAIHIDLSIDEVETSVNAVVEIDTTANMDITITAQWNNEDVGDIFELYQAFMQYKN